MFCRMNIRFLLSAAISSLFCYLPATVAAADGVLIKVPEALNVLYVNDETYKRSFFSSDGSKVKLKEGLNRLVLEYETLWDLDAENHEVVKSEPVMVSFSAKNGKYEFTLPEIKNVTAAKEFALKPVLTLVETGSQRPVEIAHSYRSKEKAFLASFKDNTSRLSINTAQAGSNTTEVGELPLTMLRYWWQQASPEQQQMFMESVGR